jgi:digeranylgeranylglycerophospholipid reductase
MMHKTPESVDILVVGAGPAGCSAAVPPAASGFRVLLIEREGADNVGAKVCGNALVPDALEAAARYVAPPGGAEVAARLTSGTFYAPDGKTGVTLPAPGAVLNRLVFGQRLLGDAVAAGAELVDHCSCVGWSDRDSKRVRVQFSDGTGSDVSARVVIDASGFRSILTRDGGPTLADSSNSREVGVGYREILALGHPIDESTGGFVVLSPPGATAGYAWVFPMGESLANVGIGTTLATVSGSLKNAYDDFVSGRPELEGAAVVSSGAGMVPLRRPLASLVGNGFMVVGDAGCQTNPLHGGGIVPAMLAGVMAGETAVAALSNGSATAETLWAYGARFMHGIGAAYSAHEMLKRLIYSLSLGDLMFLCEQLGRSERLIQTIRSASLLPGAAEALRRLAALVRRPALATRIVGTSVAMRSVRRHYEDYPDSPAGLASWLARGEILRGARRADG